MKKLILLLTSLTTTLFAISQNVIIPDSNFKAYLVGNTAINTNSDTEIQVSEAAAFTDTINVGSLGILDLTGIEAFTNISTLWCNDNSLSNLDISSNTALIELWCSANSLTSLDVSNNLALEKFWCSYNSLTNIDVSINTSLNTFYCNNNLLTNIDVSTNTGLEVLYVTHNNLSSIDVTNNTLLKIFYCNNNALTNLDVSAHIFLEKLYCFNNALTTLNVSSCSALKLIWVGNNVLTSLNVSSNTALEDLLCNANSLSSLNVSNNTDLEYLNCHSNLLNSIDVSNNTVLEKLFCFNNVLTSLDLSANTSLEQLRCQDNSLSILNIANGNNAVMTNNGWFNAVNNPSLSCIQVDDSTFSANNWTNIDATSSFSNNCNYSCIVNIPDANFKAYLIGNLAINTNGNNEIECSEASAFTGTISCPNSSISDLTGLEAFINLNSLYCFSNNISTLDLSQNTTLVNLNCRSNNLDSLNVSLNTILEFLSCHTNNLTVLDLSQNTALSSLQCNMNNLNSLNVANGNNSSITNLNFNASNNPNLTCIEVDDVVYSTTNWTSVDPASSFSLNCVPNCIVNIPDANFKSYLVGNSIINTNGNTEIECSEANAFAGVIDCSGLIISDLTGIEAFTNITTLKCRNNLVSIIDLSNNLLIDTLDFQNNNIDSIDVSLLTNLIFLNLAYNNLTTIDLSNNINVSHLNCRTNDIDFIDLSNLTNLVWLNLSSLDFTSIDLSNNTSLTTLQLNLCYNLSAINLTPLSNLERVYLGYTDISSTDFSANHNLVTLDMYNSNFIEVDLSNNPLLTRLHAKDAINLTTLNLASGGTNLLSNYQNFSGCPNLTCIQVDDVAYANANFTLKDSISFYSLDCNYCYISQSEIATFICEGETYTSPSLSVFDSSGVYSDTIQNSCGADSIIEINLSVLDIQISNNNGTLEASSGFDTYQWFKNGTSVLNETYTTFTPTENGDYSCEATKTSCTDISNTINIDIETGINDIYFDDLKIYPNPTQVLINIETEEKISMVTLKDLNGKIIASFPGNQEKISIKSLSNGIYILEIRCKTKVAFKKIIKQ